MKKLYISPELEIWCFMPMENVANGNGVDWYNGVVSEEDKEHVDASLPGVNVPGWGN